MKTLEEILALEVDALTDEDKALLKEKAGELNDEQKAKYASVLEDAPANEEPKQEETPAPGDETPAPAEETPAPATDTQEMSDKVVTIKASELALLRDKADKGAQAFKELEQKEISASVSALLFSTKNANGKFLPKSEAAVKAFMETLNKAQREKFSALIASIPAVNAFKELGNGGANEVNSLSEVEAKVDAKMKADSKLSYSEALKQVMSENKGLEERYDSELPSARKTA